MVTNSSDITMLKISGDLKVLYVKPKQQLE